MNKIYNYNILIYGTYPPIDSIIKELSPYIESQIGHYYFNNVAIINFFVSKPKNIAFINLSLKFLKSSKGDYIMINKKRLRGHMENRVQYLIE